MPTVEALILFYTGIAFAFGLFGAQMVIRDRLREKRDAERYPLLLKGGDEVGALCLALRSNCIRLEDLWNDDYQMPKSIFNNTPKESPVVEGLQIIAASLIWPALTIAGLMQAMLCWKGELSPRQPS